MTPPEDYVDLILIPALLHTPWAVFDSYPPLVQWQTRQLLREWLAGGQGMNVDVIRTK